MSSPFDGIELLPNPHADCELIPCPRCDAEYCLWDTQWASYDHVYEKRLPCHLRRVLAQGQAGPERETGKALLEPADRACWHVETA